MVAEKLFIDAQQLLEDSFELAQQVMNDGFEPDLIIGVWRGGAPIAIALQELFAYNGIFANHYPVRISSYVGIEKQGSELVIGEMFDLADSLAKAERILIVDDVFESGRTIQELVGKIEGMLGEKQTKALRVATVFAKPKRRVSKIKPDYFIRTTEKWLVFPHELVGLTTEEIRANKPSNILSAKPDPDY